ncbi:MAG: hypothetical protein GX222_04870 [Ruminococcaceae bacterium]|nr:hypothetical protein [Oscillospiraceae bacterium]
MKRTVAILLIFALMLALSSCWSSCSDAESEKQKIEDKPIESAPGKKIDFKKIFDLITGEKRNIDEWDLITGTELEDVTLKPGTGKWTEPGKKPKPDSVYTISDEVIEDNSYVTLSVVKAYTDESGNFRLKMLCKNKTADPIIAFCYNPSVNGYMIYPEWYSETEANSSSESEMVFYADKLKEAGITVVEEANIFIDVYSLGDSGGKSYVSGYYTVYPTGLDAKTVTYPSKPHADKGVVIDDNANFKFVIEGVDEDGELGYTLKLYIENYKPTLDLYFCWYNESVNGISMDSYWGQVVTSEKRAVCDAPFMREDFDKNGITKVNEIEFTLRIVNNNNWDEVFYEKVFKYNP